MTLGILMVLSMVSRNVAAPVLFATLFRFLPDPGRFPVIAAIGLAGCILVATLGQPHPSARQAWING